MRYTYESEKLSFSVGIETLNGCCGIGSITRMGVHKNNTTSKAQRTRAYREALQQFIHEYLEEEVEHYDDEYHGGWGMLMCTDITPDSYGKWGAYYDYRYERDGDINLYDFAVANKFKATKPCHNPNTDNEIVLFTKDINDAR